MDLPAAPSLLIIGYVWPEPGSSAAGLRDIALIDTFLKQGWKVIYASPSKESQHSEALVSQGVVIQTVAANDPIFDSWIAELRPDFVIYDRFVIEEQFGWRVEEHSPESVRVLDTQDLHFLRRARMEALKSGAPMESIFNASIALDTEDSLRELAAIYRSDLTLLVSDYEKNLLESEFQVPSSFLQLHRFSYPADVLESCRRRGSNQREHFVMIGNFRHPPNKDAVFWLREEIWPRIRTRLPQAEVHIYGAYPSKEIMQLDQPRMGFRIKGWAGDQFETLSQYRVNLAPLRFGAGIKGKIADSWVAGTPVVTTPIGAEGMTGGRAFPGDVASSAADFAEAAIRAYELEESPWISSGYRLLEEIYDRKATGDALIARLLEVRESLPERRRKNFIGRMLLHHQHKSTKYFSRWIELKNSKTI